MEVFGSFEADDIVREGNFGVVMSARRAGTRDRRFAIKVFRPPELSMDEQQIAEDTELFLKAAEAQRKAHAAGGAGGAAWAPIYESGTCAGGAWYATDLMQCSFEMLRIMQKEVEADHLRRVIEAIVQGLGALKSAAGRPHGNLRERNVLVTGREDLMRARIVLCDPALRNRGVEDEQRDARDLGNLIHQLVLHRPFQNLADWPLQSSERWQRMGKAGEQWLELTNRLIDPTKTAKPTIEEISASLPGGALKAAPAKKGPDPQAQRAAQEEAARQEAARRKEQEARAEAERRQREAQAAAERKAAEERAERDRIERERQERERQEKERAEKERLEKERAERERLAKEKKEAEAAAEKARQAEEKKKAEAAAAAEKARVADEKKKAEDERRRIEQEAKEKAAREKKEKEAAERKADAERAARLKAEQEEARRIAAEKQKQKQELEAQRARDAAPRPQEASASAPVAEPVAEPPVQRAAAAKPAKTGGNKGVVIGVSAAALVALGVGGWILMSGGKKDTLNQSTQTPTIAQLRESAGASLPATDEIDALLRKVADDRINAGMADASPLQQAAREAVQGAAGTLDPTLAADSAREQLTRTAKDTIRASLVAAAETSPVEGDGLSSLVDSVVAKVNQQMPGGKEENVRQVSVDAVEQLARSRWNDVVGVAVEAKLAGAFTSVGIAAVDAGMLEWQRRHDEAVRVTPPTEPPVKPPPPPGDEPTPEEINGLINTAAGINTELDTGAGGDDFGKAARQAYDALAGQKWFSRVQNNDAVRRARERIEFLETMSSAVDAGEIFQRGQQAASQAVGASELVAVWNRVGAIEAPVALDQLVAVRSATTDEALLSRFSPAARQAVQGAVEDACVKVWQRAAVAAKTDLDIDGVRKQKTALAIPGAVEQQSPAIVFNFSLRDLKAKLAAADQTSIDARKAAANEFLAKVDDAVAAAVGAAAAEPVRWAKEIRDFEPPPPVVDFAQAGPGLAGWQPQADAGGARVTYSLGGQSVVFHRVGDAYLSETEVPVSMFIRVANEQGVYNDIKGNCRDLPRGLKVWFASGASVAKATRLVANQKILNPVQWAGLPAAELEPKDDWPVQWVGARAAMVIAGRMGCRLPTAEEWQAAEKQDGGARANLRDDAFQRVLASARAFPNNDMFPDDGARDARGADVADFADADGVPFFAAVDWGDGARWRNLRGNVAEWVIMSAPPTAAAPRTLADATALRLEYGVAGGSALGPPGDKELVHRDRSPYQGYSDVGFRLAFSAPSASAGQGSIDEQVRSLLAAEYR